MDNGGDMSAPVFLGLGSNLGDREAAIANGVSGDVYIKKACTDEVNIGD